MRKESCQPPSEFLTDTGILYSNTSTAALKEAQERLFSSSFVDCLGRADLGGRESNARLAALTPVRVREEYGGIRRSLPYSSGQNGLPKN